jgi:hypothetical protein
MDIHVQALEIALRGMSKLVISKRGEEVAAAREPRELARDHRAPATGLRPDLVGMDDLAGRRNG